MPSWLKTILCTQPGNRIPFALCVQSQDSASVQIAISLGCGVNVAVRSFVSPLRTLGAEIMRLQTHEVKTVTGTRVIPNSWPFADESGLDDTSLGDLGYRSS